MLQTHLQLREVFVGAADALQVGELQRAQPARQALQGGQLEGADAGAAQVQHLDVGEGVQLRRAGARDRRQRACTVNSRSTR